MGFDLTLFVKNVELHGILGWHNKMGALISIVDGFILRSNAQIDKTSLRNCALISTEVRVVLEWLRL